MMPDSLVAGAQIASIIYYSASQLETFDRCKLKWWWEKIAGFKAPETANQALGTEMHGELETWIDNAVQPTNPRVVESLRHFREQNLLRGEALKSERQFERAIHIQNRIMTGRVDLTYFSPSGLWKVWDFKSTSDMKRYAKTDYQLAVNIQLNIYAHDTFETYDYKGPLEVAHLYIQSKNAIRSSLVPIEVERKDVAVRWDSYLRIVDQMEKVRLIKEPQNVPYNETACNDFGGCPHRVRCNALIFAAPSSMPTGEELMLGGVLHEPQMSSAAALVVLGGKKMLNPPDTTRRPAGAPAATPNTVNRESLPKSLQDAFEITNQPQQPKENAMSTTNLLAGLAALGAGKTNVQGPPQTVQGSIAAKLSGAQTPPPAPPPPAPPVEPPPAPPASTGGPSTRALLDATALQAHATPNSDGTPKRKRRTKAEIDADKALLAASANATAAVQEALKNAGGDVKVLEEQIGTGQVVIADEPEEEVPQPRHSADAPGELLLLLVDATDVFGCDERPVMFDHWLAPITAAIIRDHSTSWSSFKFNDARAVLERYAMKVPLPSAMCVMHSSGGEAQILLPYLISKAKMMFKGVTR